jgi:two-component system, OmpR family, catabolic regulation response regulator CreB
VKRRGQCPFNLKKQSVPVDIGITRYALTMAKILLIDDAEDIQQIVKHVLKDHQLEIAGTLAEAKAQLAAQAFALVLLDVGLPDGNGFYFWMTVCRQPNFQDVCVIFLTGKSDPIDKVMGFSLGARDYITKPFSPKELLERVEARIGKGESRAVGI